MVKVISTEQQKIMAKYESPCQVLGLFMGAVLVSCCVIYILTLEANKRYGDGQSQVENDKGEKFSGEYNHIVLCYLIPFIVVLNMKHDI